MVEEEEEEVVVGLEDRLGMSIAREMEEEDSPAGAIDRRCAGRRLVGSGVIGVTGVVQGRCRSYGSCSKLEEDGGGSVQVAG